MNGLKEKEFSRNSNIELLRIVCILIIVAHHFSIHPKWDFDYGRITINRVFLQSLCIGGKLGVNCFLLISGYFLVEKKNRSLESIIKIWLQMLFYAILIPLSAWAFGQHQITAKELISMIIPVTAGIWNYASAYFVLMLFVPFYNRLLQCMSRKEFERLLWMFFCFWCIIPTITGRSFESNYLIWMFVVYSVGAYIRIYPNKLTEDVKSALIGVAASFLLYLFSVLILDVLGMHILFFANSVREIRFGQMQMLPCVLLSISLFLLFKNLNIRNSRTVNMLAKGVFGIYLIHEHYLVRNWLWNRLFQNSKYYDDPRLIFICFLAVITVFLCCEAVEQLRIRLLEQNYMQLVHRLCYWADSRINHVL